MYFLFLVNYQLFRIYIGDYSICFPLSFLFWIHKGKERLDLGNLVMMLEGLCEGSRAGHITTVDIRQCLLLLTIQVFTNFLLLISWHKYVKDFCS